MISTSLYLPPILIFEFGLRHHSHFSIGGFLLLSYTPLLTLFSLAYLGDLAFHLINSKHRCTLFPFPISTCNHFCPFHSSFLYTNCVTHNLILFTFYKRPCVFSGIYILCRKCFLSMHRNIINNIGTLQFLFWYF